MFKHILGNDQIKFFLSQTLKLGTVGNSLLFAGPDGVGKSLFAEAFAKALICQDDPKGSHRDKIESGNHPDIRVYRPEGKIGMHSLGSMRQFTEEVYQSPFEAKFKVFIIHDADRMLPACSNALLKTFEEPLQNSLIILLTSHPGALLPTVLSRCRKLYFHPIDEKDIYSFLVYRLAKSDEEAKSIAKISHGSIGQAFRLHNEGINPLRGLILEMLAKGVVGYKVLNEVAIKISDHIESHKKQIEQEVRKNFLKGHLTDLSASHKQMLEKEVDGAVMLFSFQESLVLFDIIYGWYRDLELIGLKGNLAYLIHKDFVEVATQAFKNGFSKNLEVVQKNIAETTLLLERSTTLSICFENLFLKLSLA